ncbi:hypothetical protein Ndes2437A_g00655 [Nannochloris sp. 'desiccata']
MNDNFNILIKVDNGAGEGRENFESLPVGFSDPDGALEDKTLQEVQSALPEKVDVEISSPHMPYESPTKKKVHKSMLMEKSMQPQELEMKAAAQRAKNRQIVTLEEVLVYTTQQREEMKRKNDVPSEVLPKCCQQKEEETKAL